MPPGQKPRKERGNRQRLREGHARGGTGRLLWMALKRFNRDNGFFLASAITFNFLICLIPLALILLAIFGSFLHGDQRIATEIQRYVARAFPASDPRILETLENIMQDRRIVGILGLGVLTWAATWIFGSLRTALNIVYRVKKGRGLVHGFALDVFMVLVSGVLLLVSMVTSSVMFFLQAGVARFLNIGPFTQFSLKYLLPFTLTLAMSFLIYKIVPNRKVSWKPALYGALVFAVLWEVAKHLFAWYIASVGEARYSMIYGSLGTVAIFFLWVYYSSAILILGGETAHLILQNTPRVGKNKE
jgi:membrane protein